MGRARPASPRGGVLSGVDLGLGLEHGGDLGGEVGTESGGHPFLRMSLKGTLRELGRGKALGLWGERPNVRGHQLPGRERGMLRAYCGRVPGHRVPVAGSMRKTLAPDCISPSQPCPCCSPRSPSRNYHASSLTSLKNHPRGWTMCQMILFFLRQAARNSEQHPGVTGQPGLGDRSVSCSLGPEYAALQTHTGPLARDCQTASLLLVTACWGRVPLVS